VINKNNGSAMMGEQGNASMQNLIVTLKNTRPGKHFRRQISRKAG